MKVTAFLGKTRFEMEDEYNQLKITRYNEKTTVFHVPRTLIEEYAKALVEKRARGLISEIFNNGEF